MTTTDNITMIFNYDELKAYARSFMDLAKLLAMDLYNSTDETGYFVLTSEIINIESHFDERPWKKIILETMNVAKHTRILENQQIEDALLRACTCMVILHKTQEVK